MSRPYFSPRSRTILQALFVTFLWSTSWVLIKVGLEDLPALTFAGLRYTLAFLALLALFLSSGRLRQARTLHRRDLAALAGYGLVYYTLNQGAVFLALVYLPAITFSLMLNGSAVVVALLAIPLLGERPSGRQWLGIAVFLAGLLIFFQPLGQLRADALGLSVGLVAVLATALASIIGRGINRSRRIDSLSVTVISMGIGSILLLLTGLLLEPLPRLSLQSWLIVLWLALANTAFAFTLWNHTLRTLSAVESSVINNTMLIQITILAWLFLDERLTWLKLLGLGLVAAGTLLVQLRRRPD
jgi:drug/metabolite transporter (DMT)-like permease